MGKVEFGGIFYEVVVSLKIIHTFALAIQLRHTFLFAAASISRILTIEI